MSFDALDLKLAAHYIAFEMYHFQTFARLYKERRMGTGLQRQAFEYSLLLHFRVLLDFFYRSPKQDDVWVGHFRVFPGFAVAFPPEGHVAPAAVKTLSNNLNKRLAHFTATRWKETHPEMRDYAKYFDEIHMLIIKFQTALPEDVRQAFQKRFQQFEKRDKGLFAL